MFFKRHLIVFVYRKSWMSSICGFPVVQTSLLPVPVVTPTTCQITCPTLMKTWSKHWLTWLTRGSTSWSSGARAFHSSKTFWWVDIYCGCRSGTSRATKLYFTTVATQNTGLVLVGSIGGEGRVGGIDSYFVNFKSNFSLFPR